MRISEHVAAMEAVRKSRGDLEVVIHDVDSGEDFSTYEVAVGYDGAQAVVTILAERG